MQTKLVTDLDFVIAKTRAMHSRLYEGDRLTALLRHRSLSELAGELVPMETFATHTALERRLVERFAETLAGLWRHFKPPRDRLIAVCALRLQVENLKVVLRSHLAGRSLPMSELPVTPLPETFAWPEFDPSDLKTLQQLVDAIPEQALRRSAADALLMYGETPVPLFLEAGLDAGWFRLLGDAWRQLDARDRADTEPLVQFEVDLHNLMLVLRGRMNHGIEGEQIVRLAAPSPEGGHVAGWVRDATAMDSVRGMIARAPLRIRAALEQAPAELPQVERRLWSAYYALATRIYYRTFFTVACPYAFACIKRMELANLITTVEAIRYGMSIEQTLQVYLRPAA